MDRDFPQGRDTNTPLDSDDEQDDAEHDQETQVKRPDRGVIRDTVEGIRQRDDGEAIYGDTDLNPDPLNQIE